MSQERHAQQDPTLKHPQPTFPEQDQRDRHPGLEGHMEPKPDYGEETYRGCSRLEDRAAVITGGDSGIGRAVALAFAREGADVLISYLEAEEPDAEETARVVEESGKRCVRVGGDISEEAQCNRVIERAVAEFGRVDVLVNNAAHQRTVSGVVDVSTELLDKTFKTNIYAMFWLVKAAIPHMPRGGTIINVGSAQAFKPSPTLLPRSEEHTSELQSQSNLVCRLLLEKKKRKMEIPNPSSLHDIHARSSHENCPARAITHQSVQAPVFSPRPFSLHAERNVHTHDSTLT